MRFLNATATVVLFLTLGAVPIQSKDYYELGCNANIESEECLTNAVPFSELVTAAPAMRIVVPCGICAFMDYTDGSTVTLPPNGLDIVGRLHFPSTANVILNTTAVIVQGMLDMTAPDAASGNQVKVTLYGTEEQFAYPYDSCDGGYSETCSGRENMGKKPIAIVGGKILFRLFVHFRIFCAPLIQKP